MVISGGLEGIVVVNYPFTGILVSEEAIKIPRPHFASEYDELMWLAEKQRGSLTEEETRRFYELRDWWPEMHSDRQT